MNANQKSWLTTAAEVATILGLIIAYLAFAYAIGWWPFSKDPAKIAEVNPTVTKNVPTATFTPKPTDVPHPTVTPTPGTGSFKNSPIDGATMMYVPAGNFLMGSSDNDKDAQTYEKPQHTVYIDTFWIDKYEITNSRYKKCADAGKCKVPSADFLANAGAGYGDPKYDNYPAGFISWDDANAFCGWAGKRLPTEAEWEKAARGIDGRIYPWGNVFDGPRTNFCDTNCTQSQRDPTVNDGYEWTAPVGSFPSDTSPYGAMDMAGNVREWVADWYSESYYRISIMINPKGPPSGQYRVLRSASSQSGRPGVRTASRSNSSFSFVTAGSSVGVRCAQSDAP